MMAERIMCKNLKSTYWVSRWERLPVCAQPGIIKTSAAEKGSVQQKQKQLSASSQSSKDRYKWLLSEPLSLLLFLWSGSFYKTVWSLTKRQHGWQLRDVIPFVFSAYAAMQNGLLCCGQCFRCTQFCLVMRNIEVPYKNHIYSTI